MTGYRISATPIFYSDGQQQGQLKGVKFTATSATATKQWVTWNEGQFESAFSKLMPRREAKARVAALMQGQEIQFL
jgi:hypothetical protein